MRGRSRGRSLLALVAVFGVIAAVTLYLRDDDVTRPAKLGDLVRPGAAEGYNVLLVSLDTTRADRLGCYGYKQARTPAIDSLVLHGVRFDDAVSSSPLTLPSHTTMLTGQYPPAHGVRSNGLYRLTPDRSTLTEALKEHGYETAAFIACFVLDRRFGLAQGFDLYDFEATPDGYSAFDPDLNERSAKHVTDAALNWLIQRRQREAAAPFFMWVHYFDPHQPYQAPATGDLELAKRPYDAEIAFVDVHFKRLLDHLDEASLRERTLIILVSDHGEGLGDHGEQTHGFFLYEPTLRVILILSCPSLFERAYRVDDRVVGLVDLRPTIEDLLGIPSSEPVDGHSLVKDDTNPGRAVYMETLFGFLGAGWSPLYGLRRHREKYVLAPKPEYYDLREDPDEEVNLLPERDEQAAPLRSELTSLLAAWKSTPGPTHAVRGMSPQEIARLSSLGYVHAELTDPSGDLPDPKDMLPAFNSVLEAMALHGRGRSGEAVAMLREALEANEEMIPAYRMLAEVYRDLGRHEQAIDVLRRAETIRAEVSTLILLAEMVLQVGRFDPAAEILDRAEALAPDDGRVPLLRGDSLARQGRYGEAVEQYQKALEKDENRVGLPAREAIIEAQKHLGLSSPGSF